MKLLRNWHSILRNAWSIRLLIVAGLLSAAEVALPFILELYMVPTGLFAILSATATCGALVARLVAQQSIKGDE